PAPATITGKVFNDLNHSGTFTTGEPGLSTWTVYIDANHDGALNSTESRTITDGSGNYSFANLTPGVSYRIRELLKKHWTRPSPSFIDVPPGSGVTSININFGNASKGSAALITAMPIASTSLS